MKINYRNTALKLLYEPVTPFDFTLAQDDEHSSIEYKRTFGLSVVREWPKVQPLFAKRVQYISNPFFAAYEKGKERLGSVLDAEELSVSGTFISQAGNETNTIFYALKTIGQNKEWKLLGTIFFFSTDKKTDRPRLNIFCQRLEGGQKWYLSETCGKFGVTSTTIFGDILSLILFIKYCPLDTKIVNGGRREHHVGQKYVNETKHKIEILDSTWFTTIVRSEGFGVTGHFRMQPHGPGMTQRRLQWIEPFEKTGYTKKARILS